MSRKNLFEGRNAKKNAIEKVTIGVIYERRKYENQKVIVWYFISILCSIYHRIAYCGECRRTY